MTATIENLTNRPVLLRLNSGTTLHIAPRQTSIEYPDSEVLNNPKIKKLSERRIISLKAAKETEPKHKSKSVKKEK